MALLLSQKCGRFDGRSTLTFAAILLSFSCFLRCARGGQSDLEDIFRQAQAASSRKNYPEAEKLYRQVLQRDSASVPARVNLGLACYWQRKNREAAAELDRALRAEPREFSALLFSGLAHLELGDYDLAQRRLTGAARVRDNDSLLFWALGSLAMIHGDTNAAVPLLERSLSLDPDNVRAVWLIGQAYARLAYNNDEKPTVPANYAELTDNSLRFIEERQPNSALLHVFRGDVFSARELTADALAEYRQAEKIDPGWPDLHLMIGSLLGLMGRWDEARGELHRQLTSFPDDTRALIELGSVECRAGNYSAATAPLERALRHDASSYEGNYRMGQALASLGKNQAALAYLERAAAIQPAKSDPWYVLHRAYRALGDSGKAGWALAEFNRRKADAK